MYWETEITPEEEEELIVKTAEKIHAQGFDVAAILFLESTKPLAFIGGNMSRLFIGPFLPAFGEHGLTGEKLINVFEKKKNVEKLINLIEEMAREDEKRKKEERAHKKKLKKATQNNNTSNKRKGWRKYLPF
jgi:hypothetical protein